MLGNGIIIVDTRENKKKKRRRSDNKIDNNNNTHSLFEISWVSYSTLFVGEQLYKFILIQIGLNIYIYSITFYVIRYSSFFLSLEVVHCPSCVYVLLSSTVKLTYFY